MAVVDSEMEEVDCGEGKVFSRKVAKERKGAKKSGYSTLRLCRGKFTSPAVLKECFLLDL